MAVEALLIEHLDKLHTTSLGVERIRRNMSLCSDIDVVHWCKECIIHATFSERRGKNWYVYFQEGFITINAYSYTIITAHRNKEGYLDQNKTSCHRTIW